MRLMNEDDSRADGPVLFMRWWYDNDGFKVGLFDKAWDYTDERAVELFEGPILMDLMIQAQEYGQLQDVSIYHLGKREETWWIHQR